MSHTILLVEDNEQNRYLATFLLEKAGHRVLHAPDGRAALDLATVHRPDLVLMDIQMPEMDGYEAARQLRATPGLERLPIVAVTSYAQAGDRQRALEAGFCGYLEKPISTETFVSQITQYLLQP
jgi:two-component system cell cycle response regulator DivK